MVKIGVKKTENFSLDDYPEIIQSYFVDVIQDEIEYKKVAAFDKYIDNSLFDYVFESTEAYQTWLKEGVNATITKVEYDWENEKAYITIADLYNPGPHEFNCDETWTTEDCETAINNKFNI